MYYRQEQQQLLKPHIIIVKAEVIKSATAIQTAAMSLKQLDVVSLISMMMMMTMMMTTMMMMTTSMKRNVSNLRMKTMLVVLAIQTMVKVSTTSRNLMMKETAAIAQCWVKMFKQKNDSSARGADKKCLNSHKAQKLISALTTATATIIIIYAQS